MPLTIIDFIEQVDGVSTEDIPFDEREQINGALGDLTGGPGGIGAPVNDDAILVSKNLNGREGFSSIQDAVDSDGADTGDTIFVEPGEYEPVTIDVEGLRLEGPNAGIAGDSDQRGDEATITDAKGRLVIKTSNVTVDGLNFEFDESAIQSKSGKDNLITNSRFELTGTTSDTYAIRVGGGSPGTDVTNSLFTDIVSSDGVGGDNVNGVLVTDPRDTTVANNNFSNVDTAVLAGDKSPSAGTLVVENNEFSNITQFGAVALANGDAGLDADINNNTIESSRIGIGVFDGDNKATFSIQDNDFQNFANDEVFVDDSAGFLTLDGVLNNQSNTFDPDGQVVGNQIRVSGTAPADTVVNLDSDGTFTGTTAIQDAVNDANTDTGDTIRVGPGTFTESVTINTDGLTLEGPNAGIAGDSGERGPEALIDGLVAVDAEQATVDGFALERKASGSLSQKGVIQMGAVGDSASGSTIANNVITPNDTDSESAGLGGVAIESADDVTISDNVISPADGSADTIGITRYVSSIENLTVSDNVIETELGIAFGGTDAADKPLTYSASITGNQFDNSGTYSLAVYESENLDVTVTENDFSADSGTFVTSVAREETPLPTPAGDGEKLAVDQVVDDNTFNTTGEVTTTSVGEDSTYIVDGAILGEE